MREVSVFGGEQYLYGFVTHTQVWSLYLLTPSSNTTFVIHCH